MCLGILGNKIGMTQIFNKNGKIIPVTLIKCGPCYITQIKSILTDGYNAIQIGYGLTKKNFFSYRYLKEYKILNINNFKKGQEFNVNFFKIGDKIQITGLTIGKGNMGNIQKNNFVRGPMSHGSKHHRLQGSLGAGTSPGRVFPGKKMPGRIGMTNCTIKNVEIIDIDVNSNLLIVKGSIPGKVGNLINITC